MVTTILYIYIGFIVFPYFAQCVPDLILMIYK